MNYKVIIPPAEQPISLEKAKKALNVDGTYDDDTITDLISQATEYCEDFQKRKYITQTLDIFLDFFPYDNFIEFRDCSPVQSIVSIKYIDYKGIEHVYGNENYMLDDVSFIHKVELKYDKSWPTDILQPANGVIIRAVVGYGTAQTVPQTVKIGMLLHLKMLYDDLDADSYRITKARRDSLLFMNRVISV